MANGRDTINVIACRLAKPPERIKTIATTDITPPHITACQRGEVKLLSRDAILFST